MKTEVEQKVQRLLAQMHEAISVLNDLAIEHRIECLQFMGYQLHFGVRQGHRWEDEDNVGNGYTSNPRFLEFLPAAKGPVLNDEYWSYSSFRCWPTEDQLDWLYGDGPRPKTDYDEE